MSIWVISVRKLLRGCKTWLYQMWILNWWFTLLHKSFLPSNMRMFPRNTVIALLVNHAQKNEGCSSPLELLYSFVPSSVSCEIKVVFSRFYQIHFHTLSAFIWNEEIKVIYISSNLISLGVLYFCDSIRQREVLYIEYSGTVWQH